jgi:hypothetical protein
MTRRQYLIIMGVMVVFAASANGFNFEFARISSATGHFSVVLPKPFSELPPNFAAGRTAGIHPKKSFIIGGKPAPGVIFIATKMIYQNAADARSIVKALTSHEPAGFTRVYMEDVNAAGLAGVEIKSASKSAVGYRRIFGNGDTVFILSVEAPAANDAEIKQPARRFLDSLTQKI